jgi:hemerythrin-like domain-containing protein
MPPPGRIGRHDLETLADRGINPKQYMCDPELTAYQGEWPFTSRAAHAMSDAINVLLLEHRQIAKVLHLIDEQHINVTRGEPVNFRLLGSILDYLSNYPAECHHPKEDLVYRRLLGRAPALAGSIRDLAEEHWKLAQMTQNLARAVGRLQAGETQEGEGFADQLKGFVEFYRLHMRMEEERFFPLALEKLSAGDLGEIDFVLFNQPEHFGEENGDKFAELYGAINRMGLAERQSTYQRDETAFLAGLTDLNAFNEALAVTGGNLRLGRVADGYALESEGKIVTRIPACTETQAAWCAYYFWKATADATRLP